MATLEDAKNRVCVDITQLPNNIRISDLIAQLKGKAAIVKLNTDSLNPFGHHHYYQLNNDNNWYYLHKAFKLWLEIYDERGIYVDPQKQLERALQTKADYIGAMHEGHNGLFSRYPDHKSVIPNDSPTQFFGATLDKNCECTFIHNRSVFVLRGPGQYIPVPVWNAQLAERAYHYGAHGVVTCAAENEIDLIKKSIYEADPNFCRYTVTPKSDFKIAVEAVYPDWYEFGQYERPPVRKTTPKDAILKGADLLIISTPLYHHPDRADEILEEIRQALEEKERISTSLQLVS